jgi:acetate kinase
MSVQAVATFNIGSSSLKFSVYGLQPDKKLSACLLRGAVRDLSGVRSVDVSDPAMLEGLEVEIRQCEEPHQLTERLAGWLSRQTEQFTLTGIGHRIVHGGRNHARAAIANATNLEELEALSVFAPAHQPHNLAGVRAVQAALPELPQTLSFDTAFHRTIPRIAELYALPRALSEEGILRFGFHGLSYAHISESIGDILGRRPVRLIALHLGSGASACAMRDGTSIATSMGLTALDGLPMATRCGDLDPGVVLHLVQDRGMSPDDVADLLYRQSGLLGVSGISSDPRVLLESSAPEAREALDLYCYRIASQVGSLMVDLGGIDAVVFSGGVGENSPEIRTRIIKHLEWLGPRLDQAANLANSTLLSPPDAPVSVIRVEADEERIIARDCASLL